MTPVRKPPSISVKTDETAEGFKMHQPTYQRLFQTALLVVYCIGATAPLGARSQRRLPERPIVSIYSSPSSGLIDTFWDPEGPINLENQLALLRLEVTHFAGKPVGVPIEKSATAFVLPPLSGDDLYSEIEDVEELRSFVKSGGLVIVHDSLRLPRATQDLVADILGYNGIWQYCESVTDNTRHALDTAISSTTYARDFLDVQWPTQLEDVRTIQVHSWCKHEDPDALSYPLYTLGGDSMKVVAQAFTRVGSSGAVVWLGYSWQDGPQQGWGEMLGRVIDGFHQALAFDAIRPVALAFDAIRPVALAFDAIRPITLAFDAIRPVALAFDAIRPVTLAFDAIHPETARRFLWFRNLTAHGVQGASRPVVWYDDKDFNAQLNLHYNNSKLWLINRDLQQSQKQCDKQPPCRVCQRAWYPYNGSRTVVLYFREPVVLKRIAVLELAGKAVEEIFLLGWPAVPIQKLGLNVTRLYDNVTYDDVFTRFTRRRLSVCATQVEAIVRGPREDVPDRVPLPRVYNQSYLPPAFRDRAVGGVGIRLATVPHGKVRYQIGETAVAAADPMKQPVEHSEVAAPAWSADLAAEGALQCLMQFAVRPLTLSLHPSKGLSVAGRGPPNYM
ncbi:hypothetical protein VOLCADRAFT_90786 [Volvox carteri f. nagariensis]|uniref:Uncharacterized protein n=1 Tax=Volvox carteri f. nagariensis TaxID=3068 RepID=D8TV19_VOLCA|nr:uncharacterized protein VOLCADRAFT_90786 [Volvox carteri f. nagariensis]EFJ48501.1 hypothetical protein VOLCADRAFT_90786 [Volvox carteri f. nagariensis]|eukprot:XP_002950300.1 hypothetical protein VOLCADRAFT_90786 [Volvox carteri f. nagariensis]